MKLKELYLIKKEKFPEYVILIKSGNFYEVLSEDAYIINRIFNYKIKEFSKTVRVGFPLVALNKVTSKLKNLKINYLIIDESGEIKKRFNQNRYKFYLDKPTNIDRINIIYQKLLDQKGDDIDNILNRIEEIL